MKHIRVSLSFLAALVIGGECWAPGSVPNCPPGNPPTCPHHPVDDYDNLFNHPSDCHFFVHCDAGELPICKECPADLHFSPTKHVCVHPADSGCVSGGNPTTTTTKTTEIPATSPSGECTTEGGEGCPSCTCPNERIAHPFECQWYYQCEGYVPRLAKCPGGWHFNAKEKICDCPCSAKR